MNALIGCMLGIFMTTVGVMAQTGMVRGRVMDTDGKCVVGATVLITGTSPLRGAIVTPDGSYRVVGVRPGRYAVKVRALGYITQRIDSIDVSLDSDAELDAVLSHPHPCDKAQSPQIEPPCGVICGNYYSPRLCPTDTVIIKNPRQDTSRKASPLLNDNFESEQSHENNIGIFHAINLSITLNDTPMLNVSSVHEFIIPTTSNRNQS